MYLCLLIFSSYLFFFSFLDSADVPGLHESHKIEQIQLDLLDALRLELKHNHPRQRLLFPKLLLLIPDLRQITENFGRYLQKGSFLTACKDSDVTPLLKEIFDVGL